MPRGHLHHRAGRLEADARPGTGVTFAVILPAADLPGAPG